MAPSGVEQKAPRRPTAMAEGMAAPETPLSEIPGLGGAALESESLDSASAPLEVTAQLEVATPLEVSTPLTASSTSKERVIDEILLADDEAVDDDEEENYGQETQALFGSGHGNVSPQVPQTELDETRRIRHTVEFVLADVVERVVAANTQPSPVAGAASPVGGPAKRGLYKIDTGYDIKINLPGPSRAAPGAQHPSPAAAFGNFAPRSLEKDSDESSVEDLGKAIEEFLTDEAEEASDDAENALESDAKTTGAQFAAMNRGTKSASAQQVFQGAGAAIGKAPRPDAVDRPAMVEATEIFPSKRNVAGTYVFGGVPSDDSDSDTLSISSRASSSWSASSSLLPGYSSSSRDSHVRERKGKKKPRVERRPLARSPKPQAKASPALPHVGKRGGKLSPDVPGSKVAHEVAKTKAKFNKARSPVIDEHNSDGGEAHGLHRRRQRREQEERKDQSVAAPQAQEDARPDAVERPILAGDDIFPDRSTLQADTVVFGGLPDVGSDLDSLSSTSSESLGSPAQAPRQRRAGAFHGPKYGKSATKAGKLPMVGKGAIAAPLGANRRNSHHTKFDSLLKEERRMRQKFR